ncbi:type II toxin-antitoxin system PrlF family antitoxin [Serratia proteamaculans]|uniref:type II toxin-antitoxin system PrlF family antitoxin n=1 Tax=Serratia proteamaculans TaxID=28151 RepID=UPI0039BE01D4
MLAYAEKDIHPVDTVESKITERGQTTIPVSVLRALGLKKGTDHIRFHILPNGDVLLPRKHEEDSDPAINAFLHFLSTDIVSHPQNLRELPVSLLSRMEELTAGVDVGDLDALLPDDED